MRESVGGACQIYIQKIMLANKKCNKLSYHNVKKLTIWTVFYTETYVEVNKNNKKLGGRSFDKKPTK